MGWSEGAEFYIHISLWKIFLVNKQYMVVPHSQCKMGDRYFEAHIHKHGQKFKNFIYLCSSITRWISLKLTCLSWHGQTH